uniref:Uncharacterized protein n=1 Tax=Meloidogyne javanica TaxID=6303 RepID=A0A915M5J7_MELJA
MHPQLIEAYGRMRSTRDKMLKYSLVSRYDIRYIRYQEPCRSDPRNFGKKEYINNKIGTTNIVDVKNPWKTNRNCPLKEEELASKTAGESCQPPVSRISDILDEEGCSLPSGELIEVDRTRLKISKKLYKHAEKERKNALRLHIPRKILESGGGGIVSKKFGKKAGRISSSSSLTKNKTRGIIY